jgi:hypothetical protein
MNPSDFHPPQTWTDELTNHTWIRTGWNEIARLDAQHGVSRIRFAYSKRGVVFGPVGIPSESWVRATSQPTDSHSLALRSLLGDEVFEAVVYPDGRREFKNVDVQRLRSIKKSLEDNDVDGALIVLRTILEGA